MKNIFTEKNWFLFSSFLCMFMIGFHTSNQFFHDEPRPLYEWLIYIFYLFFFYKQSQLTKIKKPL
jgi:hypothetical protein